MSCARFYYRPKTPTLYDNEGVKPIDYQNEIHIPRPVYLLFSDELIYIMDTMFSDGNATNSEIGDTIEFFKKIDWKNVFHKGATTDGNSRYITNKKQAELLSKNPVSLNYLKNIIFRSEADLKQANRLWGSNDKYIVNESCFSDKNNIKTNDSKYNNYITNYNISWRNDRLSITIELERPLNNYVLHSSVEDTKGNNKSKMIVDKEALYIDEYGNITNDRNLAKKVILTLKYKPIIGDRIKIYLNKVLSIEESFEK